MFLAQTIFFKKWNVFNLNIKPFDLIAGNIYGKVLITISDKETDFSDRLGVKITGKVALEIILVNFPAQHSLAHKLERERIIRGGFTIYFRGKNITLLFFKTLKKKF